MEASPNALTPPATQSLSPDAPVSRRSPERQGRLSRWTSSEVHGFSPILYSRNDGGREGGPGARDDASGRGRRGAGRCGRTRGQDRWQRWRWRCAECVGPGRHAPAARGPPGAGPALRFPRRAGKGVSRLWDSWGGRGPVDLRSFSVRSEGCSIVIIFFSLSSSSVTRRFPNLNATQLAEAAKK